MLKMQPFVVLSLRKLMQHVILSHRSRDVAEMRANMIFDPVKINLQQAQHQCEHRGRRSVCVKTKVCFTYTIKSEQQKSTSDAGEPAPIPIKNKKSIRSCCVLIFPLVSSLSCRPAGIRYDLTLDALRAKARASFIDSDDKSDRKISKRFSIRDRETKCVEETFMMSASTLIFLEDYAELVMVSYLQRNSPQNSLQLRNSLLSVKVHSFI